MDAVIIFIAQYFYLFALLVGAIFFFRQPRNVQKGIVVCGIVVAPLAYLISRIAGHFYNDPRPFVAGHFIPLIAHAADNGFPSDHVLLAGAVAMIIWFFNRKWSVILWMFAILIGWARVASGIHHVTDIAGSVVIVLAAGTVYFFSIKLVAGKPPQKSGNPAT